jgi:hypothetical protein
MKRLRIPIVCSALIHGLFVLAIAMVSKEPLSTPGGIDLSGVTLTNASLAGMAHIEPYPAGLDAGEGDSVSIEEPRETGTGSVPVLTESGPSHESRPGEAKEDSVTPSAGSAASYFADEGVSNGITRGDGAGKPAQAWAQAIAMQVQAQMAAMRLIHFQRTAGNSIRGLIQALPPDVIRKLQTHPTSFEILYGEKGRVEGLTVTSAPDPGLAETIRSKVQWELLPSPAGYTLPQRRMKLNLSADPAGRLRIGLELL